MSSVKETLVAAFLLIVIATAINYLTGCSAAQNHAVAQDALNASQVLCILATNLIEDDAIAEACDIDKVLVPLVRPFLAEKEKVAAKAVVRARVNRQCSDAGADAR